MFSFLQHFLLNITHLDNWHLKPLLRTINKLTFSHKKLHSLLVGTYLRKFCKYSPGFKWQLKALKAPQTFTGLLSRTFCGNLVLSLFLLSAPHFVPRLTFESTSKCAFKDKESNKTYPLLSKGKHTSLLL